ncbi:MAG: peptidyl-prolyl cis-trans isomerase [Desulfobacterales bacterium]|nr:peptidyl-prolyl cis-trans isomerase [Desulfobacterales bacterium]
MMSLKRFPLSEDLQKFGNFGDLIPKTIAWILIILVLLTITGCKDKIPEKQEQAAVAPAPAEPAQTPDPAREEQNSLDDSKTPGVVLKGDDTVLARVNGVPVTQYDFNRTVDKLLGSYKGILDKKHRMKILESMTSGLAIAQTREAAMSEYELAALEKEVRAYREELLIRQYLKKHTDTGPVTHEMVQEYYDSNPSLFGAKTVRMYEMITAGPGCHKSGILETLLKTSEVKEDWKKWADTLKKRGYHAVFRTGQDDEKILHPKLRRLMQPLEKKGTSEPVCIKDMYFIVRVTGIKEIPPRPLEEVRARIRKSLGPLQIRKAVKQASVQIMEHVEIIYENSPAKP